MKFAFISLLILSYTAFSQVDYLGSATYKNTAAVKHDGDLIEFSLEAIARCYAEPQEARRRVIENVEAIRNWLENTRTNYTAVIDYSLDLINVERHYQHDYQYDCSGKYFAKQDIKISLNKLNTENALSEVLTKNFFDELQTTVGRINYGASENRKAEVKIRAIQKGLFEETAEILRLAAKEKAKQKATRDFLSFLGPDYQGLWRLHSIEINDEYYQPIYWGGQVSAGPIDGPVLSDIKLEPIVIRVNGTFVFHFQPTDNHLP